MSLGSFFHRVGSAFKKLFGSIPTWEKTAQSVITFVAPVLEIIIQHAAGTGAETTVANVIGTVQSDLATISAVVEGGQTDQHGTAVVVSSLNSIKANISGILQLAEIKNSSKQAEITSAVNLIVGEADAILGAIPQSAPAPSIGNTATPATPPPAPGQ